jgi:hypothetical protein
VEKRSSSSKIPIPISRPFSFTIAAEEIVIGSTFATKFSKFRTTAGNTFKSPLDIEIKNSGSASSSRRRKFRVNKPAEREHCGLRVVALTALLKFTPELSLLVSLCAFRFGGIDACTTLEFV